MLDEASLEAASLEAGSLEAGSLAATEGDVCAKAAMLIDHILTRTDTLRISKKERRRSPEGVQLGALCL
jgi:hypothetical protein